jgi:hypothetical protein
MQNQPSLKVKPIKLEDEARSIIAWMSKSTCAVIQKNIPVQDTGRWIKKTDINNTVQRTQDGLPGILSSS